MGSVGKRIGKSVIRGLDRLADLTIYLIGFVLLFYGCWAMWDAHSVYRDASPARYEPYKPEGAGSDVFEELVKMNPEVIGWLTVYDTNIDYPLTQAADNTKYVNTDAKGNASLSGSLFLDCRNDRHFTDFNHVIYGHHMDQKKMFGEIGLFREAEYFQKHQYGQIYFDGKFHELEFWAFLEADAYDEKIYDTEITESGEKQELIGYLKLHAIQKRGVDISEQERIVVLSTCAPDATNGRQILVGKLLERR